MSIQWPTFLNKSRMQLLAIAFLLISYFVPDRSFGEQLMQGCFYAIYTLSFFAPSFSGEQIHKFYPEFNQFWLEVVFPCLFALTQSSILILSILDGNFYILPALLQLFVGVTSVYIVIILFRERKQSKK